MRKLSLLLLLLVLHLAMYGKGDKVPSLTQRPLSFLENEGQLFDQYGKPRTDIDFILYTKDVTLFIGKGSIQYQFVKREDPVSATAAGPSGKPRQAAPFTTYRLDVSLEGANASANIIKDDQRKEAYRYYTGNVSPDGITDVHAYGKVTYKDIYPGIDWVLYTKDGKLKYDFVVHPGGKVSDIRMHYEGADKMAIGKDGSLAITTPLGNVAEAAPYSYEQGAKKAVTSRYILKDNMVSYEAGTYAGTLVIDPTVEWGTYFGGEADETGVALATDTAGYVYITGTTTSTSGLATTGAHQQTFGGGILGDAYLAKFDSTGQLQWATYYGGSGGGLFGGSELATGIACDHFGHVYISGATNSENGIATSGSFQDSYTGNPASFQFVTYLAQFNSNGIRQWGTYYGGPDNIVYFFSIACDATGNVYAGGQVDSGGTDIVTPGAYQTQYGGGYNDALLVKFDSSGNRLWATYYGGAGISNIGADGGDAISSMICDENGDVYVGGSTASITGIASANGYLQEPSDTGSGYEGFIAKFSGAGSRLWGTFINGYIEGLYIDPFDYLYIVGYTNTNHVVDTTIVTPGSWQHELYLNQSGTPISAFLMSFNPDNCTRNWGTYYSGTEQDWAYSVTGDASGHIFIAGQGSGNGGADNNSLATPGSYQDTASGYFGGDAFIAQFDTAGMRHWGTFFATGNSSPSHLQCDPTGALYLLGTTHNATHIATPDVYQESLNGTTDAFLVRWLPVDISIKRASPVHDTVCTGDVPLSVSVSNLGRVDEDTVMITYTYTGPTEGGDTLSFTDGLPAGTTETYDLGTLPLTVEGAYQVTVYLHYTQDDAERNNDTLHFTLTTTTAEPVANIEYSQIGTNYQFSDPDGLSSYTYHWDFGDGDTSSEATPTHSYTADGTYDVTLIVTGWCGSDTAHLSLDAVGTGVSGISNSNLLTVYPNPAKGDLYIKAAGLSMKRYEVVNALGQTMLNGTLNGQKDKISVNGLAAGAYYIRIDTNKGIAEKPFQVL